MKFLFLLLLVSCTDMSGYYQQQSQRRFAYCQDLGPTQDVQQKACAKAFLIRECDRLFVRSSELEECLRAIGVDKKK